MEHVPDEFASPSKYEAIKFLMLLMASYLLVEATSIQLYMGVHHTLRFQELTQSAIHLKWRSLKKHLAETRQSWVFAGEHSY